ncbi:MAG: flavodoxin reductase [Ignavibacteriales bacterium]|nr:flavodoxin reductase [Ignavibacteriales bacterium]
MPEHIVKIVSIEHITLDVLKIVTGKPVEFDFTPGQATEISINTESWKTEKRPFTFTSLPVNDFLEFIIKTYPDKKGVTNQLLSLKVGDTLILHEVFGAIAYKGEGIFIAGGAGVTPFIAILRFLLSRNAMGYNRLIFANKTKADIILEAELMQMLDSKFISILSEEKSEGSEFGLITEDFLKLHINSTSEYIYLCGPPPMLEAIEKQLANLHVNQNRIVKEVF